MYSILVVDDEKTIREGIIHLLENYQNRFQWVGEAEDGEKALKVFEEKMVDIIITDINMPRMNGIEFIENAFAMNPNVKIVIISGYDEFEFAQKALKLGVCDYLLKPLEKDILMDTLEKIADELDRKNKLFYDVEKLKSLVEESLPMARERFLNKLLRGKLSEEEVRAKSAYFRLDVSGKLYTLALVKLKNSWEDENFGIQNEDMLMGFIGSACNEIFGSSLQVSPFFFGDDKIALLVCSKDDNRQRVFIAVNHSISKLVALIQRNLGLNISVSVGKLYENLKELNKCCREAEEAIQYSIFKNEGAIVYYDDIDFYSESKYFRPSELEEALLVHIKLNERDKSLQVVEQLFEYYRSQEKSNPLYIKMLVLETAVMIFRATDEILEMGKVNGFMETKFYASLNHCDSIHDLQKWLSSLVHQCISRIEEVHNHKNLSVIEKVKKLVDAFIYEPDLSIEFLSERLYLSPNYLRHLFRQHMGKSFVEYLTGLRMEKAMVLLNDPTLKVQDVAEKLGYNDSRYFTFCFKKYCQLTPSEYKEYIQMNKTT